MSDLSTILTKLKSKIESNLDEKRISMISTWLDVWCKYIEEERTFNPNLRRNYSPGDIVSVCMGFNIGSEQGGNRPAIVLGRTSRTSKTIIVVPLGSLRPEDNASKLRPFEHFIGALEDFNKSANKPTGTRSKAILNQIKAISKQRIIRPTSDKDQCLNIGLDNLKILEKSVVNFITTQVTIQDVTE
ncbi:type II toxin-antitoxin system PemK/MazF family toxin [Acinetobacter johnsonii]|uniref:type II toxin-antitoxin system PemK/MazF family toxin n=1 Tax=Acinetobacter johnsonii TaxID=40214 RepID=UPI0030B6D959